MKIVLAYSEQIFCNDSRIYILRNFALGGVHMKDDENAGRKDNNVQEYRQFINDTTNQINDERFLRSITIILKTYMEKRGY